MPKPSLAVIGGGVAGLCAAYLCREKFDVTVFESSPSLGGNNFSGQLEENIKTPMGVILFPNRPIFDKTLYYVEKFNLPLVNKQLQHDFIAKDKIQYSSNIWLMARAAKNRGFRKDLKDLYYLFNKFATDAQQSEQTVANWLTNSDLPVSLDCFKYLVLMHAALYLSLPYESLFDLPISSIAAWWKKYSTPLGTLSQYQCIKHGSHKLIDAFSKNSKANIKCNSTVNSISQKPSHVQLIVDEQSRIFDNAIIATRPDEVLNILEVPSKQAKEVFSHIDMSEIESTLHKNSYGCAANAMTLQLRKKADGTLHVHSSWDQRHFSFKAPRKPHFISIHEPGLNFIKEEDIVIRKKFKVPVPTTRTLNAIKNLDKVNDSNDRIFFCGSYYQPSFYHEDAIQSAHTISQNLIND